MCSWLATGTVCSWLPGPSVAKAVAGGHDMRCSAGCSQCRTHLTTRFGSLLAISRSASELPWRGIFASLHMFSSAAKK